MAYNTLAQDDVDAHSESSASELLNPLDEQPSSEFPPLSPAFASLTHDPASMDDPPITRSREGSIPLRHPTPDLQSLQGAYLSNVERLEQSAERLSLSSDIGEEIKKMKLEQRRSESRRSSIQTSSIERRVSSSSLNRQLSYGQGTHASSSILGTNSIARSGGFSPAAYYPSPRESAHSGSWSNHNSVKGRSVSQGQRLTEVDTPAMDSSHEPHNLLLTSPITSQPQPLRITNNTSFNLNDVEIPRTQSSESHALEESESEAQAPRASVDTWRQGDALFSDFDGTHTGIDDQDHSPRIDPPLEQRRLSQMLNPEMSAPQNMVYYPAPVPMMLNLPQRLSKLPAAPRIEKRRTEMLESLPPNARKSAAWLPGTSDLVDEELDSNKDHSSTDVTDHKKRALANLPPQLRASLFFDPPAARQDVEIRGESAVATLDSILDASAFAPVTAFTDHPFVGKVGPEIYGPEFSHQHTKSTLAELSGNERKRKSSGNKLVKRNSSGDLLEGARKRSSSIMSLGILGRRKSSGQQFQDAQEYPEDEMPDEPAEDEPLRQRHVEAGNELYDNDEDMEDFQDTFEGMPQREQELEGAPTTLLAELQMRKQQQKKRTRAAATAFPDGMHSTLLQMDAVAQVQKRSRQNKHTLLAWEDPNNAHARMMDEDDDDVPLGLLQAGRKLNALEKSRRYDEDRPLGLIAKREMEDNEPLSHRRARLRGEDPLRAHSMNHHHHTMQSVDFPSLPREETKEEEDEDHPHETLGERMRRLHATQIPTQPREVSGDFASEMLSQLGGLNQVDQAQPASHAQATKKGKKRNVIVPQANPTDGEEETLAQRRQRLQAAASGPDWTPPGEHQHPGGTRPTMAQRRSMADILQVHPAAGAGVRQISNELNYVPATQSRNTAWAARVHQQTGWGQPSVNGYGMAPYANGQFAVGAGPIPGSAPGVDARQMDMVDRWRQSVI